MLVLAMDVVVQIQGQDSKEEEVTLLRKCVCFLITGSKKSNHSKFVVASLFLDFEHNKEKKQYTP